MYLGRGGVPATRGGAAPATRGGAAPAARGGANPAQRGGANQGKFSHKDEFNHLTTMFRTRQLLLIYHLRL